MRKKLAISIAATLLAAMLCAPVQAAYETGGVVKTILSNGVTILTRREPEAKVAAVEIFVRVGAQDEDESIRGIGQLLAGSILAGTSTHSKMKLARLVSEVGGNFHALWQWNYMEVYALTLPDMCEDTISLLADSIKNASLAPVAMEYARSSILKEISRQKDDPFDWAYSSVRRLVNRGTPYDRPFLGDPEKLKAITPKQLRGFYDRSIRADRIVVSVVGNVDPQRVTRRVEICFGNMARERPGHQRPISTDNVSPAEMVVEKGASSTYIMIGYPAPGVDSPDYPAMCIANVLLGGNKSSLLFARLREERGLGYQVGSVYPPLRGSSHLVAYLGMDSARATQDAVKTVQDIMHEQVSALCSGAFTDDDLERAKRFLTGRHALRHERTRDRAFYLGWYEVMGLGYQYDFLYADKIKAVTREDVIRACSGLQP